MNNDNIFDLLFSVVFFMCPQIGGIGTKAQYLVTSFQLIEGELIPGFNMRALQARI